MLGVCTSETKERKQVAPLRKRGSVTKQEIKPGVVLDPYRLNVQEAEAG